MLDFSWKQNYGVISFVIVRFKAFKDRGLTFINNNINTLVDEYTEIMAPKIGAKRLLKKYVTISFFLCIFFLDL